MERNRQNVTLRNALKSVSFEKRRLEAENSQLAADVERRNVSNSNLLEEMRLCQDALAAAHKTAQVSFLLRYKGEY